MSSMEKKRLPRRPLYWLLPLAFCPAPAGGGRLCGVSLPAKAGTVDAGCPEGGGHSVKTRIPGMPGPFAHCLCVVLCLGLTVLLTLMGVAFPTVRLLTDQGCTCPSPRQMPSSTRSMPALVRRWTLWPRRYPFEPKTVMDFVTRAIRISIQRPGGPLVDGPAAGRPGFNRSQL